MGRLREIPRTCAFAWSPDTVDPFIATGTRAGAVNDDFSDDTRLELWDLDLNSPDQGPELSPTASLNTDSRFYDLAWGQVSDDRPDGIIAGALESGALELWDASKLKSDPRNSSISKTSNHSGAIRALQFNPTRHEVLATSGVKGELFITDLNKISEASRLGTTTRIDDFDTLDWNKKIPHILVTGSSGGFATVWDVRAKKENLNVNNLGRKPVSAVAWNPDVSTKLATAIPSDQDPLILLWDLRNSSAPERTLRGHDQGVLSLSWCPQDSDLLLSCGKDNRNICWNAQTGDILGEFPIVTNWTFQTRWNPSHPSVLATASFDGKIAVQTIQNTNAEADQGATAASQAADGEDFFARAQTQPQGVSFSLKQSPKWLQKPIGASFGFGGKLVTFAHSKDNAKKSNVTISTFAAESGIEKSIEEFQQVLKEDDISHMCDTKIADAQTESSKADWEVMQTLISATPRKTLLTYLGFGNAAESQASENPPQTSNGEEKSSLSQMNGSADPDESFFDNPPDDDNLLASLASSKSVKSDKPFQIFAGSEPNTDKNITTALLLGSFEKAVDICLKEKRMSDAFMVAICGGQKCIDKVQAAYFAETSEGPAYLRLLASVVGKNLWDIVHNADLKDWSEVMATLCTFADETEFPDLCEALGDRLNEVEGETTAKQARRKNASFCYLAGSKLEKVVPIWIQEMQESETVAAKEAQSDSGYSIHTRLLQGFIEKVTVFRRVTNYQDKDVSEQASEWKLGPLYAKYAEYADVVAAHGHLALAEQYLNYLPSHYPAAEVAQNRIKQATNKSQVATRALPTVNQRQKPMSAMPSYGTPSPTTAMGGYQPQAGFGAPYTPTQTYTTGYGQSNQMQPQTLSPYAPPQAIGGPYQPSNPSIVPPPPPQTANPSGPPPPPKPRDTSSWNDLPEFAVKPPTSRRSTPAPVTAPFPNQGSADTQTPPSASGQQSLQQRTAAPLPPPPRAGGIPRGASPLTQGGIAAFEQPPRPPSSSAASHYAPQQQLPPQTQMPSGSQPIQQRTSSPYNPPPSVAPPPNRYAPAPGGQQFPSQADLSGPPLSTSSYRPVAAHPNAYAPQPQAMGQQPALGQGGPPPGPAPPKNGPPTSGPPPSSRSTTGQSQRQTTPSLPKYPPGDRSHIPPDSRQIYTILDAEMQRIKAKAPTSYKREVDDTERRLNLLFDHLNNEDLLKPDTVNEVRKIASSIQSRDFDQGQALVTTLVKTKMDEGGNWLVGVKRLISMSRATPL